MLFVFGGVRVQERAGRQPSMKNVPMWAHSVCWAAGEVPYHENRALMGTIFVLGTRAGVGEPPNTKNTRVSRVFRVQRGESAGEGGEAAQHEERAHVGTFCVLGCRESALARKSCPRGHDFRVGDEGWGRSHRTRKTR